MRQLQLHRMQMLPMQRLPMRQISHAYSHQKKNGTAAAGRPDSTDTFRPAMTTSTRDFLSYTGALFARIALASAIATLLCVFEWASTRNRICCE